MKGNLKEIRRGEQMRDYIVTVLLKASIGNHSVNTFQRATVEDVSQWTNVIARC
jgi:hypothetical protein